VDGTQGGKSALVLTENTRLGKALELDPAVVDYIVSLNPEKFSRLHNPVMRRLMAPRITLGRVAAMARLPLNELLERIAAVAGVMAEHNQHSEPLPESLQERPRWVVHRDPTRVRNLDLLPMDEALDADPMPPVIMATKVLSPDELLLIKHKWEPAPLYDVWAKMGGLEWFSEQVSEQEWWIWVHRAAEG
jgi:hypothetical protein